MRSYGLRALRLSSTFLGIVAFHACAPGGLGDVGTSPTRPKADTDTAAGDVAFGGDSWLGGDAAFAGDAGSSGDSSMAGDATSAGDSAGSGDSDGVPVALLPPSQSPILTYCPMTDASDINAFEGRNVIRVCHPGDSWVGCHEQTIAAALSSAVSGDRIEIVNDNTPYTECAVIPDTLANVEIVGVCGRPHLKDVVCQEKGLFLNLGRDITLTNVEISNLSIPANRGGNAAAVRDQGLGNLNLHYVYFHHNQNGILGGKGTVTMRWSRFESNGSPQDPGYAHNTYLSSDVEHLDIRNSIFLRARNEGNNLKTRAQKMTFVCSVSASLDGADSREMDISEGGDVLITNSIIQQGPQSVNSGMLGFATESGNAARRHAVQRLIIRDTDLINDRGNGTFLAYNAYNGFELELTDVRFVGAGVTISNTNGGSETVVQSGVQTLADRVAAGLAAYGTDHTLLPIPPGCPDFEYF